jgi:hypothetical protein
MESAQQDHKLNVFISYSRDDLDFADQLDASLQLGGFETTIDRRSISGGEDWKARLGALIRDADTVVFLLSPSSAQSAICAWEVEEAVRFGKRIIPVICRPLDGVRPPRQLAELDYIFFYTQPRPLRVDLRRLKGHEVGVCRHHRDASGAGVTAMHKVDDPLRKLVEAWHSGTLRPQREGRECCGRAACARKLPAVYAYFDNLSERTD